MDMVTTLPSMGKIIKIVIFFTEIFLVVLISALLNESG